MGYIIDLYGVKDSTMSYSKCAMPSLSCLLSFYTIPIALFFNSKNFLFSSIQSTTVLCDRDGRGFQSSPYIRKIWFKLSLSMWIQFCCRRRVAMGNIHMYLKYFENGIINNGDITKSSFSQFCLFLLFLLFSLDPCISKTVNSSNLKLCTQVGFHDGSCSHMFKFLYII